MKFCNLFVKITSVLVGRNFPASGLSSMCRQLAGDFLEYFKLRNSIGATSGEFPFTVVQEWF